MKAFLLLPLLAVTCCAQTNLPAVNVIAWGTGGLDNNTNVPADLTNAVAVAAGEVCSMALRADGTVEQWSGQPPPDGLTNVVAIAAGGFDIGVGVGLALRGDGTIVAWGDNRFGQCDVPPGLSNAVAIAVGERVCLGLRADGTVVAWGGAGDLYVAPMTNVPPGLTNAVAIAVCDSEALALKSDGTIVGWPDDFSVPSGLTNVVAIACGDNYINTGDSIGLALRTDGSVVSFGNYAGDDQPYVPQPSLSNILLIAASSAGPQDGCAPDGFALTTNGTVLAWGGNCWGACNVPVNLPRVLAISGGISVTLALIEPGVAGAPPTILGPPGSQTVAVGTTATLTVRAIGFPPLSYQWYFGSNALAGATNSFLRLLNAQPSQSGPYSVVVMNGAGSTTNGQPAELSVLPSLNVNIVPAITLNGGTGLTYSLQFINSAGPTNAWMTLATVTITNSGQLYIDVSAIGQPTRFYRLVQLP